MKRETSDGFVFFGATGDLASKQIFPALQALVKRGRLDMPVVAVGRKPLAKDALLRRIEESLRASGGVDAPAFEAQASTNLVDWESLPNVLSLTNGSFFLRDTNAAQWPKRFYRVVEH